MSDINKLRISRGPGPIHNFTDCESIVKLINLHVHLHKKIHNNIFNVSLTYIKSICNSNNTHEIYKFTLDEFTGYLAVTNGGSETSAAINWVYCINNKIVELTPETVFVSVNNSTRHKMFYVCYRDPYDGAFDDHDKVFKKKLSILLNADTRHRNPAHNSIQNDRNILYGYDVCCDDILQDKTWKELSNEDRIRLFEHYKSVHNDSAFDDLISEYYRKKYEEKNPPAPKPIITDPVLLEIIGRINSLEKTVHDLTVKNKRMSKALKNLKDDSDTDS